MKELFILTDSSFPNTCSKIILNSDESQVMATGNYPPQFKIFLFEDCCQYVERRLDADVIDSCFVGRNSRKLAFLRNDKIIEFYDKHAPYYKLKISDYGQKIMRFSDCIFFSTANTVQKCDLQKGNISTIFTSIPEINSFTISHNHGLMAISIAEGLIFLNTETGETIKTLFPDKLIRVAEFDENIGMAFATLDNFNFLDLRSEHPITYPQNHINQIKRHKNHWFFSNPTEIVKYDRKPVQSPLNLPLITSFDLKDGILFAALENGEIKSYKTDDNLLPDWCSQADDLF